MRVVVEVCHGRENGREREKKRERFVFLGLFSWFMDERENDYWVC